MLEPSSFQKFVEVYFLQTGIGWAMLGGMAAVMLGATGSAVGIRIASESAAGALSEKPELFGKLLVLIALPGTQGFYSFICLVFIAFRTKLASFGAGDSVTVSPIIGLALAFVGIGVGYVEWKSAIAQGETSAAAINLVAKKPDESGRAILLPALVETYALLALLAGILMTFLLTKGLTFAEPAIKMVQ
jgi:V/A-type H+-transporting ATPase subunit K